MGCVCGRGKNWVHSPRLSPLSGILDFSPLRDRVGRVISPPALEDSPKPEPNALKKRAEELETAVTSIWPGLRNAGKTLHSEHHKGDCGSPDEESIPYAMKKPRGCSGSTRGLENLKRTGLNAGVAATTRPFQSRRDPPRTALELP